MGCARVDPVVKIGLVAPFEGQYRAVGYDVIYSARLAVRQVNQAGGIGGYRVALVALDDGGNPELALETAASLAIDPAVVAVVGHWRPETTTAAAPVYAEAGLPFIATGIAPFTVADPAMLPTTFRQAYEAVTPFDETAGPYAAPAYDAFQLLLQALEEAKESGRPINRDTVAMALSGLEYMGLTGLVYQPDY
ncbi:MAG TPA: ABC transporter substrate-binding protein [Anaerolineae bacterium]